MWWRKLKQCMVWEWKQMGKENHRDLSHSLRQLENKTGRILHWHVESLHYVQPRMTFFGVTYLCSWSIQVDKGYQVMHSTLSNIGIPFNSKESADCADSTQSLRPLQFSDILRALCLHFPWSRHKLRSEHWACDNLSPESLAGLFRLSDKTWSS